VTRRPARSGTAGRRVAVAVASGALMIVIFVLFITPFLWMVGSAFKSNSDIFRDVYPLSLQTFLPTHPTLENFISVLGERGLARNLLNSAIVAVAQVVLTVGVCSLAAYGFARLHFRGRDKLFGVVLIAALIPFEVNMIPLYQVIRGMGLQSTYWALFLPWIANPFGIFLLRQAFIEVPRDYEDAARIDGASHLQIFRHLIVPLARPAIATLILLTFLWSWNAFLWPLIVMQDPTKQVVQVAIAGFSAPEEIPAWGDIFAASTLVTIPVLILFLALQRHYVRGISLAGMK
jgi:ABC-type glycerol-3-phosphate transport system permease component